jgi:methylenetetrahydrofolate dehydrogenase (NADP+)/methenyltetrahydrofolate cyclohydrolase
MLIDGKTIASEIRARVRDVVAMLPRRPRLALVIVGDDVSTNAFVRMKSRAAEEVGIEILKEQFPVCASEELICAALERLAVDAQVDGIVLQLPLPAHCSVERLTALIPVAKDVDVLSRAAIAKFRMGELPILPPVAGAIVEILERACVNVSGKDVLVLGHGRLVGAPVALLMRHNHAHLTVIDQPVADLTTYTKEADIIISGTGVAGLLRPEMLKKGVVLIDAGASEQGGTIVGDALPACAEVASVFTPVPGGVGPVTVAILLKNCALAARNAIRASAVT